MPKTKKHTISAIPSTIAQLKKLLKANPELAPHAPYIAGGIRVVEYSFNALEAAQKVEAPRGIKVSAIEIAPKNLTSKRAVGEVVCANWIFECIKQQIGYEDED